MLQSPAQYDYAADCQADEGMLDAAASSQRPPPVGISRIVVHTGSVALIS